MSNLAATDITTTFLHKRRNNGLSYFNTKLAFGNGTLTYPAGGVPVTLATLGMVADIQSCDIYGCGGSGYVWQYDRVNKKLQAFESRAQDWVSFTPTCSWVANTTIVGKARVVGDTAEFNVNLTLAGAPTSASLSITLPAAYTVDTTKLTAAANNVTCVGSGGGQHASANQNFIVEWNTATAQEFEIVYLSSISTAAVTAVDATHPYTWANTDVINLSFKVPVTGFGGNQLNGLTELSTVAIAAQTLHCEVIGW